MKWVVLGILLGTNFAFAAKIQQQGFKTHADCAAASASDATCLLLTAQSYSAERGINEALASSISDGTLYKVGKVAPQYQSFTSGSGTFTEDTVFTVTSANATVGATYTNNSVTWTVQKTIAAGTILVVQGNGTPLTSGTLTKTSGTGDSTITFSAFNQPIVLKVLIVGGGGGGGGSGTAQGTLATSGGISYFGGGSGLSANGGTAGSWGGVNGGNGGTANVGIGYGQAFTGSAGGPSNLSFVASFAVGGNGGASCVGGAGSGGAPATVGVPGMTNSGGGGGGGGANNVSMEYSGAGGGAGGCIPNAVLINPSVTYLYGVGTAGSAGGAGTGTGSAAGANAGAGFIGVLEEY